MENFFSIGATGSMASNSRKIEKGQKQLALCPLVKREKSIVHPRTPVILSLLFP